MKHYLEVFDITQFHFLLFEELIDYPRNALADCFQFLGVAHLKIDEFPLSNEHKPPEIYHFKKESLVTYKVRGEEKVEKVPAGSWVIKKDFRGVARFIKSPRPVINARLAKTQELLGQEFPTSVRLAELYDINFKNQESELASLTGLDLSRWNNPK